MVHFSVEIYKDKFLGTQIVKNSDLNMVHF